MKKYPIAAISLAAFCSVAAWAASAPPSGSSQSDGQFELKGATCSQFLRAVEAASEADGEAAASAQDELVITLFWIHGFVSGKSGTPPKLDSKWMSTTVTRLNQVCKGKAAADKPISVAVLEL